MSSEPETEPLIGAIDQGTSSSRFFVFSARDFRVVAQHQIEVRQSYPHTGWVEEDPAEILKTVADCMKTAIEDLRSRSYDPGSIRAVGITNQRETTVVWDKKTGKPFGNAIVWMDNRTADTVETLIASTPNNDKEFLKNKCGLPFSPYFSAVKLRWLLDNKPGIKESFQSGNCLFGTIDSWLIWNLTGGVNGGIHVTDVTNASRTMLMDLQTLSWDQELCNFFKIPMSILPEIKSSAEIYGSLKEGPLKGTVISGCLGDQSAALLGHRCLVPGEAKNTYGTGCFILYNTGTSPVQSKHGLLTTVAFQLGPQRPTYYALEGSVAVAGQAIKWLRDSLGLIKSTSEVEPLAGSVDTSHGVYFVPAFSGLYAPHWNPHARGTLCGLTQFTSKAHILRAALEAVSYQTKEIIDAMNLDSGGPGLTRLNVDGGMTVNRLFLQIQADILGIPIFKPQSQEATVLGAALAAAAGVDLFDPEKLREVGEHTRGDTTEITPRHSPDLSKRYHKWRMAIERSKDWNIC